MIRVEAWKDKDMLGHVMVPLRSAVPLESKDDKAPARSYRLIGSGASLDLTLGLEEVEKISPVISEDEREASVKEIPRRTETPTLSPVLMEKDDGSGGYFLIGPEDSCHDKFSLTICLVCTENLHLVPAKGLALQQKDPFYFQYHLLGVDISTEQFYNIEKPEFVSEKATAIIHSNQYLMRKFLSSAGVSIKLCHGATVLGAAEVELGNVLPDSNVSLEEKFTFQGNVDMVSAHNLSVAVDGEGNKARVGIMVVLERQELNLSTGRLSDVDMEDEVAEEICLNNNERINYDEINNDNLEINMSEIEEVSHIDKDKATSAIDQLVQKPEVPNTPQMFRPSSPPTKLHHTGPQEHQSQSLTKPAEISPEVVPVTPTLVPQSHPTPVLDQSLNPAADTTDYLSLPPQPTKSYKLSVELKTIHLKDSTISYQDSVLAYKYLALHKEVIATPPFSVYGDRVTSIPGGYCQFSFAVQEEKMQQTFRAHLLKIGLYVGGQMRGKASVDLSSVVNGGEWSGAVDLLGSEGVLGQLQIDLLLEQKEKKESDVQSILQDNNVQTSNMLAMAARELEAWKMDQKKKFNDSLVQVEVQHLSLLGKEWREREKEREKLAQEQAEKIRDLEQELRRELEKMEVQKREMDEAKRSNDIEREKIGREKLDLKNEKVALVEKLRQQVKEKDAVIAVKSSEIDGLIKKLDASRLELEKGNLEKNASRMMDNELKAELAQLRAQKTTWGASIEQVQREKKFYMENCEQLRKEVVQLQIQKERTYTDKIAGLERQVAELSRKLLEHTEVPIMNKKKNVEVIDDTAVDVETQTLAPSNTMVTSDNTDEAAGLARLEDNLAMVMRTGVYTDTDYVVVQLKEQIKKKRQKLRARIGS